MFFFSGNIFQKDDEISDELKTSKPSVVHFLGNGDEVDI